MHHDYIRAFPFTSTLACAFQTETFTMRYSSMKKYHSMLCVVGYYFLLNS